MLQIEACCFHDDQCQDIDFTLCLEQGGLPMGSDTVCLDFQGLPCGSFRACCWTPSEAQGVVCDDLTRLDCEGAARLGRSLGRGVRCDAIADIGCDIFGVPGPCCLLDGSRIEDLLPEYCLAIRGEPTGRGVPCPPPPTDDECRFPQPDREVGPIRTLEGCATVLMRPAIGEGGLQGRREGYGALASFHGVRNDVRAAVPCRPAVTDVYLDDRRYGEPVFCSSQRRFPGGPRAHEGVLAIQPEQEKAVTRPGYGVFVASYNAPDWSETIVGSMLMRCQAPVD